MMGGQGPKTDGKVSTDTATGTRPNQAVIHDDDLIVEGETIDAFYDQQALDARYNDESPDLSSSLDNGEAADEETALDETEPKEIYRCDGLELVRWPLMEKVQLVLDTHCLHVLRGRLLTLLRSGAQEASIPLRDIVSVVTEDGSPSVTFTM